VTADDLYALELFAGLDGSDERKLAGAMVERTLAPGAVLFAQGDPAESCFVVLEGEITVEIAVDGHRREQVSVLGRGDLFGEVALLDRGARSATCIAGPDGARVAELPRADFDRLYNAGDAFAYRLMDVILDRLVHRLREATRLLVEVTAD
jgi:CRP-like cAMP-binding protein